LVGLCWYIPYFTYKDSEIRRAKVVWALNNLLTYNVLVIVVHFAILTNALGFLKSFLAGGIVILQIIGLIVFLFLRNNAMKFYQAYDGVMPK